QKNVTKCSAETLNVNIASDPVSGARNNRLIGYSYDAAGDMISDGSHAYSFDAEGRITAVDNGAATYVYGAENQRLRKNVTGQPSTEYVYFGGNTIAEINDLTGAWTNYIFF